MKDKIVILGASIFAEDIAEIILCNDQYKLHGFVEGKNQEKCGKKKLGLPIFWIDEVSELAVFCLGVCAAMSRKRAGFINKAEKMGLEFIQLIHSTAWVSPSATIQPGCIINSRAVIAAQTVIGKHTIVNRGALIGHHVEIGDYVTISPGANLASKVKVGSSSYIAMGAVILNGVTIGKNSIVGAGAVVTKDVPDNVQVVGVPARIVKEIK